MSDILSGKIFILSVEIYRVAIAIKSSYDCDHNEAARWARLEINFLMEEKQ
jgi:hypothetical protein